MDLRQHGLLFNKITFNAAKWHWPRRQAWLICQTSINTDASDTAVGAVLQQYLHGVWTPISFFSRKLLPAEKKYSTFDKELLAVYMAVKKFRYFIEGRRFAIFTDHKPLTFVFNKVSVVPASTATSLFCVGIHYRYTLRSWS